MKMRAAPPVSWMRMLAACALWAFPARADDIYVVRVLRDFNGETQGLAPGFSGDDFHVHVPRGGRVHRIALEGRRLVSERIRIRGFEVVSDYEVVVDQGRAWVFQLGGLYYVDCGAQAVLKDLDLWKDEIRLAYKGFNHVDMSAGCLYAQMDHIQSDLSVGNTMQLRRFGRDLESEVLLELPIGVQVVPLADGFLVSPDLPTDQAGGQDYRAYTPAGKERASGLSDALNSLFKHGSADASSGVVGGRIWYWGERQVMATHLDRAWALVRLPRKADEGKGLFVLSTAGAPLLSEVVMPASGSGGVMVPSDVIILPSQDVFLARVKESDRVVSLWLCPVEKVGDRYRARCHKVGVYECIDHLTLSRDGTVLAFATFLDDRWAVAAVRIEDLFIKAGLRRAGTE